MVPRGLWARVLPILLSGLALMPACTRERQAENLIKLPPLRRSAQFKETSVHAHPEDPIEPGQNYVYCMPFSSPGMNSWRRSWVDRLNSKVHRPWLRS